MPFHTIIDIVLAWHNIKCQPTQCQIVCVQSPRQCLILLQDNVWLSARLTGQYMILAHDYTKGLHRWKGWDQGDFIHNNQTENTRLFRPILTRDGTGTDRNVECMHSIHIGFRSASWKWQSEEYPLPSDSWSGTWHWLAGRLRIWEKIFLCVY